MQGPVDYLEEEAQYLKGWSGKLKRMRKDHRKRILERLINNPAESQKLIGIMKLTNDDEEEAH